MSQVFISYSRSDQAYVERLAKWLSNAGIPVWFDHQIVYGATWTKTIESNLDASAALVVVMTYSARESDWVSREVARAERKKKPIFPLLLSGEPLLQFETTQYEDVTNGSLPSPQFADALAKSMGITLSGVGSDLLEVIDRYRQGGVLVLGRFTPQRRAVLDVLTNSLRARGLIPVLFDFEAPATRDITETLLIFSLAVRFIIADLTAPKSVPFELANVLSVARVPVIPLIEAGEQPFAMFADLTARYPWVLPAVSYADSAELASGIERFVIAPAEAKFLELHPA